ncbi:MAG: nucleotide exchange factor GrpE [Acidobacteria bacterium]|nr:nucleotide exchange factor GrpE [Acidobacteriota bacterium]
MEENKERRTDEELNLEVAESEGAAQASENQESYIQIIEALRKERDEYYDLLLRKQAEFDNFRKRVLREKEDIRSASFADVLKEILPVVDGCEKGLASMREIDEPALQAYREGYELLLKRLQLVLERFGVGVVPGVGSPFDPKVHEAVQREESTSVPDGMIVEEYRKGYTIKDRLLRAAQVKVAVRPSRE